MGLAIGTDKKPPLSPLFPPDQNQAQNEDKIGGGSFDSEAVTSTKQYVSLLRNIEIHAQKLESGGSGGISSIVLGREISIFEYLRFLSYTQSTKVRLLFHNSKF